MKKQRIALFHPWIKSQGGAERVVLELLKNSKHKFDLYTWVYDKENTFPEFKKYKINVISPKFGKRLSRLFVLRGLFLPLSLINKIPIEKYDKLLISTSGVGEFITFRNRKFGKTYAYVHTPLREASDKIIKWNIKNKYNKSLFKKGAYLFAVRVYKFLEKISWKKLDVIIFNSEFSKSRAHERKLLKNQQIHVINPPIDTSRFKKLKGKQGNSFVYISRFNPPKRQDILIEAWKKFSKDFPRYKLFLLGTPENKEYYAEILKSIEEEKNIILKSKVSDKELDKILSKSLAGIFLGYQEDFGIVPIEVLSANKPLLAVDQGGYMDLIKEHPMFHKISEKHEREKMVKEVEKALRDFVKNKKKKLTKKLATKDFIKEIDEVLGE